MFVHSPGLRQLSMGVPSGVLALVWDFSVTQIPRGCFVFFFLVLEKTSIFLSVILSINNCTPALSLGYFQLIYSKEVNSLCCQGISPYLMLIFHTSCILFLVLSSSCSLL